MHSLPLLKNIKNTRIAGLRFNGRSHAPANLSNLSNMYKDGFNTALVYGRRFNMALLCAMVMLAMMPIKNHAAEKINSIVAIVNYQSISRLELKQREADIRQQAKVENTPLTPEEVRRKALDSQIFRLLQLQEAKRLRVSISAQALNERLAVLRQQWGVSNERKMRELVRTRLGIDLDEFHNQVREEMEIEAAFYREVYSKTDVFDEEVEHFLQTETNFGRQREYLLRHFLAAANNAQERRAARVRVDVVLTRIYKNGEKFDDLARESSDDKDSAENGGLLEWRTAEQLPREFAAEAQNLKIGDISTPIATGRGFHLLKLIERRGGQPGKEDLDRLRISHLFLPSGETEKSRQLRAQIEAGADFEELVVAHSIDKKNRESGGDLGWFLPNKLPDYFADVSQLKEGEVSPPIVSPYGVHLVKITGRERVSMQQARQWARNTLRERRALAQRLDWVQQLRGRAYIIITDLEYAGALDEISG